MKHTIPKPNFGKRKREIAISMLVVTQTSYVYLIDSECFRMHLLHYASEFNFSDLLLAYSFARSHPFSFSSVENSTPRLA